MVSFLKGKKILITGGTGSIGKAIAIKALANGAKIVKIFSNDEYGQYEMEKDLNYNKKLVFFLGDIRDADRVNYVVNGIDIIFHAAALKHVDRCEYNPSEAITVNIIGTKNVISAAQQEKAKKLISISTDKAVNPVGVMGATKLLSEKMISAESIQKNSDVVFASVRFGNVIKSRGSILPVIEKQIQKGGPITLTDKRMQRFFMTMDDAVNLTILAAKIAKGGETFVLKMPFVQLADLFEMMKKYLAPKYGYKSKDIKTKLIGMRPGEKLIEELLTDFELENALETKNFFIIPPHLNIKIKKQHNSNSYFSKLKPLNNQQILKMLKSNY